MTKNRKYIKNRRYSENRPVQPKSRKNRKLNRFLTGWGIFIFLNFFYFPGDYTTSFWPFVLKWKSNPKPKLKSLSPHLQASSSDENLTVSLTRHASSSPLPQSSSLLASVKLASSSLVAGRCSLCTAAHSAQRQRRSLHSGWLRRSLLCSDLPALLSAQQHR